MTWLAEGFTNNTSGTVDFSLGTEGEYRVEVSGDGLETTESARFQFENRNYTQTVDVVVKRKAETEAKAQATAKKGTVSANELAIPPKALKKFEKASELMAKKEWDRAIKPLNEAISLYPNFAAAYHDLGVAYSHLDKQADAQAAWRKAITVDDRFAPSYISLAKVDIAQHNFVDAEVMLKKALVTDVGNSQIRTLLANVELLNGHYADAIADAKQVHSGSKEAHGIVHWIAARAYEHQNQPAEAKEELQALLTEEPAGPLADKAKAELAGMTQQSAKNGAAPTAAQSKETITQLEAEMPTSNTWAPPDIDQSVPQTVSTPPCPVSDVLRETSERVKELVDNLQRFSAEEEIEHMEVDNGGYLLLTKTGHFKYVAEIQEAPPQRLVVNEYRNSTLALNGFPSRLATRGTAAFALIFHSDYIHDFSMRCEGRATMLGKPAWVVRFEQRADKPPRFRNYYVAGNWYPVKLKGRAWIAADDYQVLRLETDLLEPIQEIDLKREHLIIEYHAVDFPKRHVQLWLPATSDIYLDYRGHRYHDRHSFSDFQLFWIETNQKDATDKLQAAQAAQ